MTRRRGLLLLDGSLKAGAVHFENGRITSVEPEPSHADVSRLPIVAPGLIDLHVHGYGGAGPLDDVGAMADALAREGTTGFLATLFPDQPKRLGENAARAWESARALAERGTARVLGLHLEGPFVNPKSAGALPEDGLAEPSVDALREILGPATGDGRGVRTMTLAPELDGSPELVRELARSGVRVSLGHSLATADEARSAARAGAVGATHLYNAMRAFHHREAGLVGFALSNAALCSELIGDLVHVGRDAVELALAARGPSGLALVSDALAGAGTGCTVFHSHGHECRVEDGAIWIADPEVEGGRRLTGAAASQLEAVRRLTSAGVVSIEEALVMGSETPARALGLEDEVGRLVPGARADLLILGPKLELLELLLGGESYPISDPEFGASDR